MKFISGLKEISHLYTHFIFDVWGVIHDGSQAYPGAVETVAQLRKEGKKICFLSNAPRRASIIATVLKKFGITPELYDFILSSGEATFLDLETKKGFKDFGKNYYYIGPQKDINLLEGLEYVQVDSASKADFALTTGFDHEQSTLAEKLPYAIDAKEYNLPMICVNPDMIVVKQNGHEIICAGALAAEYERIGGKVIYYGKPFSTVYKMVCEIFNNPETKKIVAIGDGLETDIKGAVDFGIDNILVTGGILINSLDVKHGDFPERKRLEEVCSIHQIYPNL